MTVTIQWHDSTRHTIRFDVRGRWNWEQIHQAVGQANAMLDEVNYKVDILVTLKNGYLPADFGRNVRQLLSKPHRNFGAAVITAGGSRFIAEVFNLFCKMYSVDGSKFYFAVSLDHAETLLAELLDQQDARI